jgi:hypothetical protein
MTSKYFWRGVLMVALSVILAKPAEAKGYPSGGTIVAAIVGVVAVVVIAAVVVIHKSSEKRSITGCVNSGENGMSMTDEKDKRLYALSGTTTDVKPGDRRPCRAKRSSQRMPGRRLAGEPLW